MGQAHTHTHTLSWQLVETIFTQTIGSKYEYVTLSLLSSPLPLCLPSSLLPLSFMSFMFNLMISVKQWHWLQLLASGYRQMEPFNYWIGILHNNKTSWHKLLVIQTQWKVLHTQTHTHKHKLYICDEYILTMSVCLCLCVCVYMKIRRIKPQCLKREVLQE